jgi:hypothetical protein
MVLNFKIATNEFPADLNLGTNVQAWLNGLAITTIFSIFPLVVPDKTKPLSPNEYDVKIIVVVAYN